MILESRKTTLVLITSIFLLVSFMFLELQVKNSERAGSSSGSYKKNKNNVVSARDIRMDQRSNFSQKGKVSILFGGDMMFDRYIRNVIDSKGFDYVLGDVKDVLHSVDFAVANLEGPITGNESKSVGSEFGSKENYIFTFPQKTAQDLFKNNITVVNIGNNHILNFGQDGLGQTRQTLKKANVRYFGDPANLNYSSYIKEFNGIKVGFVCYNEFVKNGAAVALDEIVKLKEKVNTTIVYAHWGTEYETGSNQKQRDFAHRFIDNGADLVIGSHPHVVQEAEIYDGKEIYYSLGNFIFDQYFEDSTKEGLLVRALIDQNGNIKTDEIMIQMDSSGKTSLVKK